jgi:predicted glycogen debranching enzyme
MTTLPISWAGEWLEPDGSGGFASGTVGGERTRRYHALLLAAAAPPTGRLVLINGIEAWLDCAGHHVPIDTQRYSPNVVYPDGREHITAFSRDPWPRWVFSLPEGTEIAQEIFTAVESQETVLRWQRRKGTGPCRLVVRLLLSGRDYHSTHHENSSFSFDTRVDGERLTWHPYASLPAISALTNGTYAQVPKWYRRFLYTEERDRGLDCNEDLASPGTLSFDLETRTGAVIVLSAGDSGPVAAERHASALTQAERMRRETLSPLARSAQAYAARRGAGKTLIAGYPWFTDWGRDTFIAMRGLLLARSDIATAKAILIAWAATVSDGMLPNRFPDSGGVPEYNAVDASLWYIVAVHEFLHLCETTGVGVDEALATTLQGACEAILEGYTAGTRFGIGMAPDGLLRAGVPGLQLTWMDAKVGDVVITPRIGKPVEIQALWINALRIASIRWSLDWKKAADRAQASFARFIQADGSLVDVLDADHVSGKLDASRRPNQIFAVGGLPFAILGGEAAHAVVMAVEATLLTPIGLRSLCPSDPAYVGQYRGGPAERDGAYHQGTVWPWLMGGFVDAWLAVHGRDHDVKEDAKARFLAPLMAHLNVAGLGHVSEIADGDAPHAPAGCPFQAWSLGELIRIRRMVGLHNDDDGDSSHVD